MKMKAATAALIALMAAPAMVSAGADDDKLVINEEI